MSNHSAKLSRASQQVGTGTLGEKVFRYSAIAVCGLVLFILFGLIFDLVHDGSSRLAWGFLTGFPSRFADKAGIAPALLGSLYLMMLTASISLPLGVGAALYLEEYAPKNRFTRFIELNVANLAGVPSIIYGILGLEVFVRALGMGRSLLAGACTLSLLVMPLIILSAREAIRRVPNALREAGFALGATKWETVRDQVLPVALPGILTGCILGLARAIGETAPLITMGALTYVAFVPDSIFSPFSALPIQAFNWVSRPQAAFHQNAAAAIVVLLCILLCLNAVTVFLRNKYERRNKH